MQHSPRTIVANPSAAASAAEIVRRAEPLKLVLMAGFALRAMHEMRETVPGGLPAGLVLLDVVLAGRERATVDETPGDVRPAHGAEAGSRTVSETHRATGIPRETARRHLADLVRAGWLKPTGPRGYGATERSRPGFALQGDGRPVADFLRVVVRLRELQRAPAVELNTVVGEFPWQGAMSTRRDDVAEPGWHADLDRVRAWLDALPASARRRCGSITDGYLLRHLIRLREAFAGDLMLPLILGEIGHRNISALSRVTTKGRRIDELDRILERARRPEESRLRPVNAYSLAVTMGIPDATIRRKVAFLVETGWLVTGQGGTLNLSGTVVASTASLNATSHADLCACFDELAGSGLLPPIG